MRRVLLEVMGILYVNPISFYITNNPMNYYKPEWVEEDRQRVIDMQRWYILDGRHRPDHPYHNLYTNLAEKGKELDDEFEG